jgi:hypothetical protein
MAVLILVAAKVFRDRSAIAAKELSLFASDALANANGRRIATVSLHAERMRAP